MLTAAGGHSADDTWSSVIPPIFFRFPTRPLHLVPRPKCFFRNCIDLCCVEVRGGFLGDRSIRKPHPRSARRPWGSIAPRPPLLSSGLIGSARGHIAARR